MTVWIFILGLVFGFLAFRHFRNGRFIWGSVAAFGSLLMAGSVWVDYQRAAGGPDGATPPAQAAPTQAAPQVRDYDPGANSDSARVHRTAEEANADLPWGEAGGEDGEGTPE